MILIILQIPPFIYWAADSKGRRVRDCAEFTPASTEYRLTRLRITQLVSDQHFLNDRTEALE
jgi:hypothetical protein